MSGLYVINDNIAFNLLKLALFTNDLTFSSKAKNLLSGISSVTKSSNLDMSMYWLVVIKASKSKSALMFLQLSVNKHQIKTFSRMG